jgi:hypothetical protein
LINVNLKVSAEPKHVMPEQIPITPAVLIWARERAGLSREEVLQKFKRFADWETGKSFPTYPQLEQLSKALQQPHP